MRRSEFRAYLQQAEYLQGGIRRAYTPSAIANRVALCARLEREQQCDLDREYARDQLESVLENLSGNISNAVTHYKNFCIQSQNIVQEDLIPEDDIEEEDDEIAPDIAFKLESQLRDFIAQNIRNIPFDGRQLSLHENGVEFPTEAGFIDILAIDDKGNYVVFELKRGRTPDHVIGQLARYMGWVKQNIGKEKEVYGIVVAKTIGDNLHYAQAAIPNVSLLEYEVKFELNPAQRGQ